MSRKAVVTGGFSYIGGAIAAELAARGWDVSTLTNRKPPPGSMIASSPLTFDRDALVSALTGADLFVNTFWIRFPFGGQTFDTAVARSALLAEAAKAAGVGRFVHLSVSNPDRGLNLGYYAGKHRVEETLRASGLSCAIVRPTLVVGPNDVLTNNIAWFLRNFPVFPMPRGGRCRLQPVTLADTARIAADAAARSEDETVDAAGPDTVTFREYVELLASLCGVRRWMPGVPNWASLLGIKLVEPFLDDVTLTREELLGLEQELLISHAPPLGKESALGWLEKNGADLGKRYINDLDRHFRSERTQPVTV